jgi:hypothetical protein
MKEQTLFNEALGGQASNAFKTAYSLMLGLRSFGDARATEMARLMNDN